MDVSLLLLLLRPKLDWKPELRAAALLFRLDGSLLSGSHYPLYPSYSSWCEPESCQRATEAILSAGSALLWETIQWPTKGSLTQRPAGLNSELRSANERANQANCRRRSCPAYR